MLKIVSNGEPFDCTYCKKNGELSDFVQIKKLIKERGDDNPTIPRDRRKRRAANSYESLIPFQMQNGEVRELYTRAIVKFNKQEVIL